MNWTNKLERLTLESLCSQMLCDILAYWADSLSYKEIDVLCATKIS
jgi:hypothetical protein